MKERIGAYIAQRAKDGETLGLGSGTTAEATIRALGERIRKEKIRLSGVPTSLHSAQLAEEAGIQVLPLSTTRKIDWAFDGADEVDPALSLIKGKGGALLPEKILARRAGGITVIVLEEKLVPKLGSRLPLPIEVVGDAATDVAGELRKLGATHAEIRSSGGKVGPVVTDYGNFIIDTKFPVIDEELDKKIKLLCGVVETGLFFGLTREVVVLRGEKFFSLQKKNGKVEEKALS